MRLAKRLLAFAILAGLSIVAAGPLVGLSGTGGITAVALYGAITSLGLFGATVLCVRRTGQSLSTVGIEWTGRRARELGIGFVIAASLYVAVILIQGAMAGGHWQRSAASLASVAPGLVVVLCLLLSEELLFRGFAFRQIADQWGPRAALVITAIAFGIYHVERSGNWSMGAAFTFLMPALGGLIFGYALLRSGSLALPAGLHWGGNWVQAQVLGLGHTPDHTTAIWAMPLDLSQAQSLLAPDLLQHLPYLGSLAVTALLVHRITMRGVAPE